VRFPIDPWILLLLIGCGLAGGFINTIAASGATVTLPGMIAMGLEPAVANGTNRLAAVAGLATATWRFQQAGAIPWGLTLRATAPMVLGASVGSLAATAVSDTWITLAVAVSLLFVLATLITQPGRLLEDRSVDLETLRLGPVFHLLMALTGLWAGFISLGSGVMTLLVLVLAGRLPLKTANILKCFVRLSSSLVALAVFGLRGSIDWLWALPLALSSMAGAWIAAQLALGPQATQWIFRSLVLVVGLEVVGFSWRLGLQPGALARLLPALHLA
jgi:uncharacterized membrane protein YfcA